MSFLKLNSRVNLWIASPLLTIGTFSTIIYVLVSQVNGAATEPTLMAQSRCTAADLSRTSPPFRCVTPKVFSCLKRNNSGGGGSLDYRGDTSGEIVVKSNVAGTVALLGFKYDASHETLNLNVKKKNLPVQDQQIWDGVKNTLSKCR